MTTNLNYDACELFETQKECWLNFKIIEEPRSLSDFQAWSITQAFKILFNDPEFDWWWYDANMHFEDYCVYEKYQLGMTENGILVLRVYTSNWEQISQYVVKML